MSEPEKNTVLSDLNIKVNKLINRFEEQKGIIDSYIKKERDWKSLKFEFTKKIDLLKEELSELKAEKEKLRSVLTEIKSKASGQILFLGAEIGDYVDEGIVLARIDQRTPTNTLAQANADLEVAKVRLSNAKNQFERSKRLLSLIHI